jgi:hypothetical protein
VTLNQSVHRQDDRIAVIVFDAPAPTTLGQFGEFNDLLRGYYLEDRADVTTQVVFADVDSFNNLDRAEEIVAEIENTIRVQKAIRAAFAQNQLDGGVKAADAHPLMIQATAKLAQLQQDFLLTLI